MQTNRICFYFGIIYFGWTDDEAVNKSFFFHFGLPITIQVIGTIFDALISQLM